MVALGETISGWKLGRGRGSRLYSGGSRNRRAVCAGTVPMVNNLYQGMPLDPATGLYYERARWYSSARAVLRQEPKSRYTSGAVHREISQDPAGYINGADTYQFVMSNPVGLVDPTGRGAQESAGYYSRWHSNPYLGGPLPPYAGAGPYESPLVPPPPLWFQIESWLQKQHWEDNVRKALHFNQENGQDFVENVDNFIHSLPPPP